MRREPKKDRLLGHEICSKDLKCIAHALAHDAAAQVTAAPNDPESVHIVRIQIKKMRALLRLIRSWMGKARFKQYNVVLRDAARRLSTHRDAQVVHATCQYLATRKSARPLRPWLMRLEAHFFYNAMDDLAPEALNHAVCMLERSAAAVDNLSEEEMNIKMVARGLRRAYDSARKALQRARSNTTTSQMHEFRKRVKCLLHQMDMVIPVPSGASDSFHDRLRCLGNRLGHLHDLAIVRRRLAPGIFQDLEERPLSHILSFMKARHQKLERRSLREGRAFFKTSSRKWLKAAIRLQSGKP